MNIFRKTLTMLLAICLVAGIFSSVGFAAEDGNPLTVASSKVSNLAPGVQETEVVAYDKNGDRVVYYVVNANIATNSDVLVKANYHDNDNTGVWGKATVVEQANAATEKRGYNVVATTNAAYYNVSTGQPTGAFVMEGVNINGNGQGDNHNFFAIMKDGTAMIGKKGTFSQYADQVQEAVGGWTLLLWEGTVQNVDDTNKYPRSTVGIKANGDVVLMLADGNQKPYSAGLTLKEQGELMKSLGCEYAVELDGGGSATYAAKLEGTDEVVVRSTPCDGTTRSVSNSIMVISTAVADGTFDHANLSTDYAFYAPNSAVKVDALGADAAGKPAELPADAVWALSDDSFGTVENGIFRSNGKLGTVTVRMLAGDKIVGEVDVTLVDPTEFAFAAESKKVPYGKTSDFSITAMYNGAEMFAPAEAFEFSCTAGSMNGFIYEAPSDESISGATVTARYQYASLASATVNVEFGKGSDILFDFEDADLTNWVEYNGLVDAANKGQYTGGFSSNYGESSGTGNYIQDGIKEDVFLASKADGAPVYSGEYSLGYTLDYTQSTGHANWQYAYLYYLGDVLTYRDVEKGINGTRLGMWMYIPEEAVGLCARLCYTYEQADGTINTAYLYFTYQYVEKGFSKLTSEKIPEAGWAYVYCDMDQISQTYVTSAYYKNEDGSLTRGETTNYAPAFIQFIVSSSASGAEKCTLYIDDITLDYSDVVDDRDAPIISNPLVLDDQASYSIAGNAISFNKISVTADVAEDMSHGTNYTGLDIETAQIYVDGHKVDTKYSAGKISAAGIVLPNGTHDITFEIADKQGNYTRMTRQLVVEAAGNDRPVVTLEGQAPAVNGDGNLYTGAQYNLLLKTDKVEGIQEVSASIWLNSASKWALEHMTVLPGFEVSYELDELACTARITVTRVGDVEATGAATLVTIPVYAWSWDGSAGHDAHYQWATKGCAPQVTVSYKVEAGSVVYTQGYQVTETGYIAGFGNIRQDVATELNSSIANLKNTIGEWHYHTEVAVADLAPTCTTDGFSGRTICSVCQSVLNWGKVEPATGHTYAFVNGLLQCACGELFTGEYTDGKVYVDGAVITDGWAGDKYYVGGVALTGIRKIDGFYYNFGDDGICQGQAKYSGIFTENGKTYYAVAGSLKSGWLTDENGAWYYFDKTTFAGAHGQTDALDCGIKGYPFQYSFENGKLESGVWYENSVVGTMYFYGPDHYESGMYTVDGKTYYFNNEGRILTGLQVLKLDPWSPASCYIFDAEGVLLEEYTGSGVVTGQNGSKYFLKEGFAQTGLQKDENGDYYLFRRDFENPASISGTVYVGTAATNGLLPAGTYEFGADFKLLQGIVEKEDGKYYYVNGKATRIGWVKDGDDYYCFDKGGKAITGTVYVGTYLSSLSGNLLPAGTYLFTEEGKLFNGIVEENGQPVCYKNGQVLKGAGLTQINGTLYFINADGSFATGSVYVGTAPSNGLVKPDTYLFGADGRMLDGIIDNHYYVQGKLQVKKYLVELDGGLYYINADGSFATGSVYVGTYPSNGLVKPGTYLFGADGRMLDGIIDNKYYVQGKLQVKKYLVELDGGLYYINSDGSFATGSVYVGTYPSNGLVKPGTYLFGADGRMLDGIIDNHYYVEGQLVTKTYLTEINGSLYYINSDGSFATGSVYVGTYPSHGMVKPGNYLFGADGKMLNGIIDNKYYVQGQLVKKTNLTEIDGKLYYIDANGNFLTGEIYVGTYPSNGLVKAGIYEFGADGAMLNGIVRKADGLYHYVNGQAKKENLICLDGLYYFVGENGKIVTDVQNYYIGTSPSNNLLPAGNYDIDENGVIS